MWLKASTITGCSIQATDGEIGSVSDLLFDDESWSVRWLVVDAGSWLFGRKVLLPSSHLREAKAGMTAIPVDLTRDQVKGSPEIDTEQPVSRQMETSMYGYYGWAPYWPAGGAPILPLRYAGAGLASPLPGADPLMGAQPGTGPAAQAPEAQAPAGDPHLRSFNAVSGYYIQGTDEDIGHVDDVLVDAQGWTIRYIIVDTGNWWPGKQVLVAPSWVEGIDWGAETVRVARTRQEIKDAPEYDPGRPLDRGYEGRLHTH